MLNKSKLGFFFCVNSIHNPYVNPEIDEHYLSREMGYSLCNIMQKGSTADILCINDQKSKSK